MLLKGLVVSELKAVPKPAAIPDNSEPSPMRSPEKSISVKVLLAVVSIPTKSLTRFAVLRVLPI